VGALELVVLHCRAGSSVQRVGMEWCAGRDLRLGLDWVEWGGDFEWLRQALRLLGVVKMALDEQGQAKSCDSG
jgi:hypothetical protein